MRYLLRIIELAESEAAPRSMPWVCKDRCRSVRGRFGFLFCCPFWFRATAYVVRSSMDSSGCWRRIQMKRYIEEEAGAWKGWGPVDASGESGIGGRENRPSRCQVTCAFLFGNGWPGRCSRSDPGIPCAERRIGRGNKDVNNINSVRI